MVELVRKAEQLKHMIESNRKEIDNPVLSTAMIAELEFFIENLKEDE